MVDIIPSELYQKAVFMRKIQKLIKFYKKKIGKSIKAKEVGGRRRRNRTRNRKKREKFLLMEENWPFLYFSDNINHALDEHVKTL